MEKFQWYSVKTVANLFNVKNSTVRAWMCKGLMPKPDIRGGRFTRWKAETIEPFLADPIAWRQNHKQH